MLHADRALAFLERAGSGKVCIGIHTSSMSPQMIELYGIVNIDFVILGQEVESLDLSRTEDLLRAANASGTVPIVKLQRPDANLVGEVMNIGAPLVMVPHIMSRKQLDLMIRASRFEPEGLRGECPIARYNGYGALDLAKTHEAMNRWHGVIPLIEDYQALDHLDEILSCEDIDMIEVGPYDLSRSLGETGQGYAGAKTMAAIEKICEAAARHHKVVASPIWHTKETDSYPGVYARQMDELIARGVTCLYEIETAIMALHMTRLTSLRQPGSSVSNGVAKAAKTVAAKTNGAAKPAAKPAAMKNGAAKARSKPATRSGSKSL